MNLPANIHTHRREPDPNAIINIEPGESMLDGQAYSVSIHPWDAERADADTLERLSAHARDPRVIAIGETGLDRLRGPEMAIQERLFRYHAALAEELDKPLIIHCVRAFDLILRLKKEINPTVTWIIHGFRGKPELARQLLAAGFHLSLGQRFNQATAAIIPPEYLHHETDEEVPSE